MRNAAGEFDNFEAALDVALGVGNGLAMLARQAIGELVVVALGEFEELHHDAGAALRICRGPFDLRGLGVLDGGTDFRLRCQRHLGLHIASHRLEYVSRPARGALDLLTTDEMSD